MSLCIPPGTCRHRCPERRSRMEVSEVRRDDGTEVGMPVPGPVGQGHRDDRVRRRRGQGYLVPEGAVPHAQIGGGPSEVARDHRVGKTVLIEVANGEFAIEAREKCRRPGFEGPVSLARKHPHAEAELRFEHQKVGASVALKISLTADVRTFQVGQERGQKAACPVPSQNRRRTGEAVGRGEVETTIVVKVRREQEPGVAVGDEPGRSSEASAAVAEQELNTPRREDGDVGFAVPVEVSRDESGRALAGIENECASKEPSPISRRMATEPDVVRVRSGTPSPSKSAVAIEEGAEPARKNSGGSKAPPVFPRRTAAEPATAIARSGRPSALKSEIEIPCGTVPKEAMTRGTTCRRPARADAGLARHSARFRSSRACHSHPGRTPRNGSARSSPATDPCARGPETFRLPSPEER